MARMSLLALFLGMSTVVLVAACGGQVNSAAQTDAVATATPACETPPGMCWLTSGGTKFTSLAKHGPQVSFGGNVYPSCSPDPGDGGQWNHIDHAAGLHFMGTSITVVQCGNMGVIPDGSTSPVTSVNFIEFTGSGWLQGISRKSDQARTPMCFWAHVEDRSEPGSRGQTDDLYKDRYYIRVYDCDTEEIVLELGTNGTSLVPVMVTTGNLQLHESSCP